MLDATILKEEIKANLELKGLKVTKENELFLEAVCQSVVNHVKTYAVVKTTGSAQAQTGRIT